MTVQEEINRDLLYRLVESTSDEQVTAIIEQHPFFKNCSWQFYGNMENNAGIIKAQSPDPVGALVEKITNGNDALLVRLCWQNKINPITSEAPQSQLDAIRKFYGENVANFELTELEIRDLASNTVRIIAEGDSEKPTLTVVDFGEGQNPSDFPDTFLSIGHSNKTKIKFAHGVYNQGGSAALKFCGSGYQLILSRRNPDIPGADNSWGFTLVRERYELGSKAEQYEYCVEGQTKAIPHFPYESLAILPAKQSFESGSCIRLYSYSLKNPNLFITGQRERELAREINKRYFYMPLPIELDELRTHLKGWSKANEKTRIYGLWRLLKKQVNNEKVIRKPLSIQSELGIFGLRDIEVIVLNDQGSDGQSYKNQQDKVFLTVNGQAQYTETVNFLKTDCLLPDLAPFLIIHIDLSNAGYQANKIFQTARNGMIETPEYDNFYDVLVKSIKEDENLKELDREYRERKLIGAQPESKDLARYITKLIKGNNTFISFLQPGLEIPVEKPIGPKANFTGVYMPTIFENAGDQKKLVPCNRYSLLRLKTDAVNDYLTRTKDKGSFSWNPSSLFRIIRYSLHDGIIPIRVEPYDCTQIGKSETLAFELSRPSLSPLKVEVALEIGAPVQPKVNPSNPPRPPTKGALKLPERKFIPKAQWAEMDPAWNGSDIGKVVESNDGITVYINAEPDVLTEFPKRMPKYSAGDAYAAVKKRYEASIYLYAISMFFEMGHSPEDKAKRDWAIPYALKAISRFLLDLEFSPGRSQRTVED